MLQPVPINWVNIKPNNEGREQPNVGQDCDKYQDTFPVCVKSTKGDIWQEGEGKQQATEEPKNVGDVIDPWQEATEKQEEDNAQKFQKGLPWLLQHLPSLEQLNEEASKQSKLRPCWTHLCSVGQEQSGGEVPSDAAEDVDDGDTGPACQLLQVSQYGHLKHH